jgi:nitric oxide dioxygenase
MVLKFEVLERTFQMVAPRAEDFVTDFYNVLFVDSPEVKPLLVGSDTDLAAHQRNLIVSCRYIIGNMRYPDILRKSLRELGARHLPDEMTQEHYSVIGAALFKTLATYLGTDWTPDVEKAWQGAYGTMSEMMLEGAQEYKQSRLQAASVAREYKLHRQKESPSLSLFGQPMRGVSMPASIQATPTVLYSSPRAGGYAFGKSSLKTKLLIGLGGVAIVAMGIWVFTQQKSNSSQPAPNSRILIRELG